MLADTVRQMEVPSPEMIAELSTQWIDPVTDEPPGTKYCLYPTRIRGANTQGSYLVYLPPGYEQDLSRHYPVIFWLHGGFGNARQGGWAVENYHAAIKNRELPELIIVLVQGLPIGWYVDSKNGKLPIEQVLIKDLIPHIDAMYRTIADRAGRGIEGHSMGGYGALRLGLKYPNLFGSIFSVAPSILRDMNEEPSYRTSDTFVDDQDYYEKVGPWELAKGNANSLSKNKTQVLILAGEQDSHLLPSLYEYHDWLTQLCINHLFSVVGGAGHDYREIVEGNGKSTFSFWKSAFGEK